MAKDPAFLFYPGDYLRDTQTMSEKTQVAYDRIMCEHMRNICIRQSQLKFFTKRLSEEEIDELMYVLTKKGDCYQITWVAESIEKRRAYSESRRKNRKSKTNNISKTYDKHMENENENENENVIKDKTLLKGSGETFTELYPSFEDFWDLYDKKVGKKEKIKSKWDKLPHKVKEVIMEHIPKYIISQPEKKYRKNPETYLNNESWKDEIVLDKKTMINHAAKNYYGIN